MTLAVVAGVVAQAVAWLAVRRRGTTIWATAPLLAIAGAVAVIVGRPALSKDVGVGLAVGTGLLAAVALYAATFAFVSLVAPRWTTFDRHARVVYTARASSAAAAGLVVAAAIAATGEELFWRGLTVDWAGDALGSSAEAAAVTWMVYVLVNAPSGNLAIVAGAVVGGAAWTALALWSGGVLASIVCHACWTGLMIARPVVADEAAR